MLEEAYEVADAIDNEDSSSLCEELGDVLLQVAMHSQIASEKGDFDMSEVISGVCKKLVYRHPHIFKDAKAETSEKVLKNWDALKRAEKNQTTYTSTLTAVPKALPALLRAEKVQKRAKKAGFDWDSISDAFPKISEETDELKTALENGDSEEIFEEFGDLLFAAVNVARFLKIDPEQALTFSTNKFISRFEKVENEVLKDGKDMKDLSLKELDKIWDAVKH